MATNFRVYIHQTGENLHLRLSGGFDGSSAYELVKIIDQHFDCGKKIIIHTSGLSAIHSFGMDIFKSKYSGYRNLVFTGEPGREAALRENRHIPSSPAGRLNG